MLPIPILLIRKRNDVTNSLTIQNTERLKNYMKTTLKILCGRTCHYSWVKANRVDGGTEWEQHLEIEVIQMAELKAES